jgi:hypothetical protein
MVLYNIISDILTKVNTFTPSLSINLFTSPNFILVQTDQSTTIELRDINYSLKASITPSFNKIRIQVENDTLLITDDEGSKTFVLVLTQPSQVKGSFYLSNKNALDSYNFAIFPRRGIYYQFAKAIVTTEPLNIFYNIANPAIAPSNITISTKIIEQDANYFPKTAGTSTKI